MLGIIQAIMRESFIHELYIRSTQKNTLHCEDTLFEQAEEPFSQKKKPSELPNTPLHQYKSSAAYSSNSYAHLSKEEIQALKSLFSPSV